MKPEAILQSDVLDILFEGKNKEYGAYSLRKNYNKRLIQALGATCLLVALFTVLQSMKPKDAGREVTAPETIFVDLTPPKEDKPEEKKPEEKKPKTQAPLQPTIHDVVPVIKPDVETTVVDRDSLEGRITSNVTNDVPSSGGGKPPITPPDQGSGSITTITEPVEDPPSGPLMYAEVMPAFNGDLLKYMLRNIRQPEDLNDGEKIVVRVKFVVTENGEISSVEIVQSGRRDLDEEVIRVVKKMPKWRPGRQGGRNVPVYFQMPVTFVSNTE